MISLIALPKRRGALLLFITGILLLLVMLHQLFMPAVSPTLPSATGNEIGGRLFSLPAQLVSALIWSSLSFFLALIWSRALFASTALSEVYIVGALIGSALLPIAYVASSRFFQLLGNLGSLPQVVIGEVHAAYLLFLLFIGLLLGVLLLIGREMLRATVHESH